MQAPGSKLVIYLTLLAVGATLAWYGFRAEQKVGEDWLSTGSLFAGLILIPIFAVQSMFALLHTIGRRRLLRGHNVIARWHVPASVWRRSEALEQLRAAESGLHTNIKVKESLIDRGIDVVVGTKSLLVGNSYHPLRRHAVPLLYGVRVVEERDPGCIEFQVLYPRRQAPGIRLALRVPFTAESRSQAMLVFEHFAPIVAPKVALALRRPQRTIAVSLAVSGLAAGATTWGLANLHAEQGIEAVPFLAAVIGAIVAAVGLIFSVVAFLHARKQQSLGVR